MSNAPTHYGWLVSPYTAKTRAYLQYSQQPFVDVEPSVWTANVYEPDIVAKADTIYKKPGYAPA